MTGARLALLRRLVESGGGLFRYQIELELVDLILELERDGLIDRHFRRIGRDGTKMLKISITDAGRAALQPPAGTP